MPYALLKGEPVEVAEIKACSECRHRDWDDLMPGCESPSRSTPDLVRGNGRGRWIACEDMRSLAGNCGPDGKLWEPKQ